MPSYEKIESKLTKKEVENNKDITNSLLLEIVLLGVLLFIDFMFGRDKVYIIFYPTLISLIISVISLVLSIIISTKYTILRYKNFAFSFFISTGSAFLMVIGIGMYMINNCILDIVFLFIIFLVIKKLFFNNFIKTKNINLLISIGSFLALLTTIWEVFFGKGNFEEFVEATFIVIFLSIVWKIMISEFDSYYKTLFYLLTYPEEFRKKFGYSVKEWYGVHSPQYKAKKEL